MSTTECLLVAVRAIHFASALALFGEIVFAHYHHDVIDIERMRIDPARLDTIARLGGNTCSTIRDRFEMATPTLADICLVPQIANARRSAIAIDAYPTLARIEAHCLAVDAFARAAPDRQPDAS